MNISRLYKQNHHEYSQWFSYLIDVKIDDYLTHLAQFLKFLGFTPLNKCRFTFQKGQLELRFQCNVYSDNPDYLRGVKCDMSVKTYQNGAYFKTYRKRIHAMYLTRCSIKNAENYLLNQFAKNNIKLSDAV